jgi:4-carboxymuconolactone decarboxylase
MPVPPEDIYPESGYRLPLPRREDMDEHGREVYDLIVGESKRGLRGNTGINLHNPRVAELETALNQYLQSDAALDAKVRELGILVTTRELDSQHQWSVHEVRALKEGIPEQTIDVIKHRRPIAGLPELEAVIIQFGRELFGQKRVTSQTFARALKLFGAGQLVTLVSLMGNYAAAAVKLRAFDVQLDPDQATLPVV